MQFENKDEPEEIFQRLANANLIAVFSSGMTEKDLIKSLSILFSFYQSELSIQDHYSINMEWEYESCKLLAKQLHNEGLMKFAAQFYATAYTLNSLDHNLELSFAVTLHRMGKHSSTYQLLKKYLDLYPTEFFAYIIACTSCAIDNNLSGLISLLKQAKDNNVDNSPIFDLFKGFYLERSGDLPRAKNYYQKKLMTIRDDPISQFFENYIKRISSIY
jgi:tetratricopeptide (TPR) repeat protein